MGYSASALLTPRLFTSKSVRKLSDAIVWLVSGEGAKSPKTFYLAAAFKVFEIKEGFYEQPDFKNSAHGYGHIFGETILLSGLSWFDVFKNKQSNFRNSLTEITDNPVILIFKHFLAMDPNPSVKRDWFTACFARLQPATYFKSWTPLTTS